MSHHPQVFRNSTSGTTTRLTARTRIIKCFIVFVGTVLLTVMICKLRRKGVTTMKNMNKKSLATSVSTTTMANQQQQQQPPKQKQLLNIQIVSDIHIEFYNSYESIPKDIIIPRAPILALLGDIGLTFTDILKEFLLFQSKRFDTVLVLAGNHEFYNHHDSTTYTIDEQLKWLNNVCSERNNLILMEQTSLTINGVRVLGTTLWSDVPQDIQDEANHYMNDYHLSYIKNDDVSTTTTTTNQRRKLTSRDTTNMYQSNVKWLEQEIYKANKHSTPVLVLTHHTPLMNGTSNPKYNGNNTLNHCFSTDLYKLLNIPVVKVWASGHTHYNYDITINKSENNDNTNTITNNTTTVRVVSNQRGYPNKQTNGYNPDGIVIQIPS